MNKVAFKNKLFSLWTLGLALTCLVVNFLGAKIASWCGMPLFLDSIGTVVAAVLGGYLPGIAVGFISNLINSFADPISRYYGILSITIACIAVVLSRTGLFKKWWGYIIAFFSFAFVGGAVGSLFTWLLYGGGIGEGISAPFATSLFNSGWSPFWAQFTADVCIDLGDKAVTVAVLFLVLFFFPQKLCSKFPLGNIYSRDKNIVDRASAKDLHYRRFSLKTRITALITVAMVSLSVLGTGIGVAIYIQKIESRYADICQSAVNFMIKNVDGDEINTFVDNRGETEAYTETEQQLNEIYAGIETITYMYVYIIEEDKITVVFDVDTPDLEGETCGTVLEFDPTFEQYKPQLLAGEKIPPVISNDTYGWLITVYEPIKNSEGITVAYAGVDIHMTELVTDIYEYAIRILSISFGVSILLVAFCLWYADKFIVNPVKCVVNQTKNFENNKEDWLNTEEWKNRITVNTGDELEELYNATCNVEIGLTNYIGEIKEKSALILRMQRNIVYAFANMVESRDKNTGEHIKRTSFYVKKIASKLAQNPKMADVLTPDFITQIIQSAPLHDIGKISISDVILNKQGKLTDDEFAVMKTHTTAGCEILESALNGIEDGSYLHVAKNMAHYHHERWDGKGYPCGLKGDEIPICARIMAVADVFDALLSARSYKPPFAFDRAVGIINEESGSHFDADVVAAFNDCLPEIKYALDNNAVEIADFIAEIP